MQVCWNHSHLFRLCSVISAVQRSQFHRLLLHLSSQLIYGCRIQRCKNVESRHQESSQAASKYKSGAQLFLETCSYIRQTRLVWTHINSDLFLSSPGTFTLKMLVSCSSQTMVPTYHSTHSHNYHGHNINKTTSFLALLFLDTFTSCSMLFKLQSTGITTTELSCIMQHSLINFIMGVLLYKFVFTTLTHSIAEDCFIPLPPPPSNRKRNLVCTSILLERT